MKVEMNMPVTIQANLNRLTVVTASTVDFQA